MGRPLQPDGVAPAVTSRRRRPQLRLAFLADGVATGVAWLVCLPLPAPACPCLSLISSVSRCVHDSRRRQWLGTTTGRDAAHRHPSGSFHPRCDDALDPRGQSGCWLHYMTTTG